MTRRILFIGALLLTIPCAALAHGTETMGKAMIGNTVITLDAIVPKLHAEQAERLNFEIESATATPGEDAEILYTDAWMRITGPDDEFLFSGNIKRAPEGLVTGFSYSYPRPGVYEIALRFLDGDRILVETSFPITIYAQEDKETVQSNPVLLATIFITGGLLGLIAGMMIRRNISRKT